MRKFATLIGIALIGVSPLALAQTDYPSKRIEVLVGYPAGGGTDVLARVLAEEVRKSLGREVIVVNHPGASGTVAMSAIAAAKPDGYKLAVAASASVVTVPLLQDVPDLFDRTTALIAIGRLRNGFLVKSDSPYHNVKDLIEFARNNPGKVSIGVQGEGSSGALIIRAIAFQEKVDISIVPFTGEAPALTALLGGHITASAATVWTRQVDAGALRLIASMDEDRFDSHPNVATMMEQGGYPTNSLIFYVVGPKGLSPTVTKRIVDAFAGAMLTPAYIDLVTKNEMRLRKPLAGEELERFLADDRTKIGAIVAKLGLRKK